jgi:hypothetical protein
MLWRAGHGGLRVALANFGELMTEHCDFLLVLLLKSHVGLLHGVDLFPDHLHFADLSAYCKKGLLASKPRKE